jgi:ADP-heptose:LPS heptosyltransferase
MLFPREGPRKIILKNEQAPGDILMLTAAVRDIHVCQPGRFVTDVRTTCPELWENNPYIEPLAEADPGVEVIDCKYPLVLASNQRPVHFLHGFTEYLSETLGVRIAPTEFKGDIYLREAEREPFSMDAVTLPPRYWLIVAGGKQDFTIKWWSTSRFQDVVNQLRGFVEFVQVGAGTDHHPKLEGVTDLRGRTSVRELIQLVYRAEGVLCPVTFAMHLAAAVECPPGRRRRACVVVAGGREAPHWEAYPSHQFIHTVGALDCCATGGCWRSRTKLVGDGDVKDLRHHLCVDVVDDLPRCMDLITADSVVARIRMYLQQ